MKMKKILSALLAGALALGPAWALASGAATSRRIFDQADLLTPGQEAGLQDAIAQFQQDTRTEDVKRGDLAVVEQPQVGLHLGHAGVRGRALCA